MKRVIFTDHAKERIKKRGLTEEWVMDIIKTHNQALPKSQDGTQELRKDRDGSYYFAVVREEKSVIIVVTAGECGKP